MTTTKAVPTPFYTYRAKVINVVDGDTFDAIVDLGFDTSVTSRFRLYGYDAPETFRPRNLAEKEHGLQAKQWLTDRIKDKYVIILTVKDTAEKYGRMLALVYDDITNDADIIPAIAAGLEDKTKTQALQYQMIAEGLAKKATY